MNDGTRWLRGVQVTNHVCCAPVQLVSLAGQMSTSMLVLPTVSEERRFGQIHCFVMQPINIDHFFATHDAGCS